MLKRLFKFLGVVASRRRFEAGMSEELRFHIDECAADLVRSGVPPEEAMRRARMEFGGMITVEEECREARGVHLADEIVRQLRYAGRMLRKSPGFTATALLTLAICIGANLAIFAVIDSVLLRPLPFPDADRLVTIFNSYPQAGVDRDGSSLTNYYERRGRISALPSLALYRPGTAVVGEPGATEREAITRVSPEFFSTLQVSPVIGRAFTDEETTFETDSVAIVTDNYWKESLNADKDVIGRRIRVDGLLKTVIGVLPRDFHFLSSEARIYLPLSSQPQQRTGKQRHSGGNSTHMIARLAPGSSIFDAQAQINAHNASVETDNPDARRMADAGFRSVVAPLHADHVAAIRPTLLLLQGGVLLLLLIGVVNIVNLLLIRFTGRSKELALRQALGANRRHVLSEVLVETGLLALLGGLVGFAVGAAGTRLISIFAADRIPLSARIVFDERIALTTIAGVIVIGVMLAAPIGWFSIRRRLSVLLQSETRGGTASRPVQRLRHGFIVTQIGLAVVLLAGAGLLALSLKQVMAVSPGFRPENILTGQVSMPWSGYSTVPLRLAFTDKVSDEISRQPGVVAAGIITNVPLSGDSGKSAATVEGHVLRPGESPRGHYSYGVDGNYFSAMGISLLAGRFLTAADSRRPERVCVVDEDFARLYWQGSSALGRRLWQGFHPAGRTDDAEAFTVVGVVRSVKQAGLTEEAAPGAVYYPYVHRADRNTFIAVRTVLQPESSAAALQKIVRRIDPDLPFNDVRTMETRISASLVTRRAPALLASLFATIAVLLTAIGTYGVLSYSVAQRRREIGVRMALGARPEQIRRQFFLLALRLLAPGAALGLIGAILAGQAMRTVLFHVAAFNLPVLAGAACVMAVVALLACLLPSWRASRVSPVEALADQ